ncbi:MAG: glycosyltransferase [Ruminococcus sp.]|nr:glycosyltransferase [Ruminococcus sp.]
MPAISVIVPIYNGEQFIHKCIDSVLSQTFSDLELIIVDDGSTDHCPQICDEYSEKDSRVIVIHGTNKGVSIARNIGLAVASGEYVAFCDGDDYFKENLLERTYNTAVKQHADVVAFNAIRLSNAERRKTANDQTYNLTKNGVFEYLCKVATWETGGWQVWRSIFKRKIIDDNNIRFCDKCCDFAEDLGFTLEFSLFSSRIAFIDDYLYFYNDIRESSMMNKSKHVYKVNEVNELSYYLKPIMTKVLSEEQFSVIHHHIIQNQVVDLYSANNKQDFQEWNETLKSLDKTAYFLDENKQYYIVYRKQKGLFGLHGVKRYFSSKKSIIHRYLCDLNIRRLLRDLKLYRMLKA